MRISYFVLQLQKVYSKIVVCGGEIVARAVEHIDGRLINSRVMEKEAFRGLVIEMDITISSVLAVLVRSRSICDRVMTIHRDLASDSPFVL